MMPKENQNILIYGANWLGDSIMSMPAIGRLKALEPTARITILTRAWLHPLWKLQPDVNDVLELQPRMQGTLAMTKMLRGSAFARACIFPNSFRSALIPFLSGVPNRRGFRGHWRSWMLSSVARYPMTTGGSHQSLEYAELLGLAPLETPLAAPRLSIPPMLSEAVAPLLDMRTNEPMFAVLPGAARGPSKRWPAGHFAKAARAVSDATGWRVLVLGSAAEIDLCRQVADQIGTMARSVAGMTDIAGTAALIRMCRLALSNDSGGMHLAAAVGVPVVAVYGLTDPAVTGPLGPGHRIICRPGVNRARDIDRDSPAAVESLNSIPPDEVVEAALAVAGSLDEDARR